MAIEYTKFKDGVAPEADKNVAYNKRWWASKDDSEMAQNIASVLQTLVEFDGKRQTQYQISTRLYGNADIMGVNGLSATKITQTTNAAKDRISYNVVQSAIDTVTAKIAKNRPKPLFLTS